MHTHFLLLTAFIASTVCLPLNINLGAYSPALVVGDGEISFGGEQDVTSLMNALEGAAQSSAAANGAPAPASENSESSAPVTEARVSNQGISSEKKEIAPRISASKDDVQKRDLVGFNRALTYATEALKTGPKIQLGTPESGVGIIVEAGIDAPAAAEEPTAGEKKARAVTDAPKMKTTVTRMYIRGGPASIDTVEARSLNQAATEKRASSDTIDAVNLNMADGQVAELTFVETKPLGE